MTTSKEDDFKNVCCHRPLMRLKPKYYPKDT